MTTVALLGFLLSSAAPAQGPLPAELCIIEQPVNYIVVTDPAKTVAAHCSRPTERELAAVAATDGVLLERGVYHLFILPNEGPVRIEWAGQATGTQIYLSVWNGKAFDISDLRGEPGARVTYARDVRRPAAEEKLYVMVNSTNGQIATDGVRVLPLARVVARPRNPRPEPAAEETRPRTATTYWAWCRSDNKAVLVASSTARGLTPSAAHDLEHLANELGPATWYPVPTGDESRRTSGRRFEAPTVTEEDGLRLLELGGCDGPGAIYSTAPTAELSSAASYGEQAVRSMRRTARRLVGRTLKGVDPEPAPDAHIGLRLCPAEDEECSGWMLLDAKHRPRRLTAPGEPGERRSWLSLSASQGRLESPRWLRPRSGPLYWVGFARWDASSSECDGETCGSLTQEGVWLIWMRGAKLEAVKVVVKELAA